jgi:hypothetical protein
LFLLIMASPADHHRHCDHHRRVIRRSWKNRASRWRAPAPPPLPRALLLSRHLKPGDYRRDHRLRWNDR